VSGISPGCWSKVGLSQCDSVDITEAVVNTCVLTIDGHDYALDNVPFKQDLFWPYYSLDASIFVGAVLVAAVQAFIARPVLTPWH
jgi:hypothetical protein